MHHKRGKPSAQRAGCKCCKPWKLNSASATKYRRRKDKTSERDLREQMAARGE